MVLNAARNGLGGVRCGFITGKKLGKAVRRNRARRLIREAVRVRLHLLQPGWDLVWIGRAATVGATYEAVERAVDEALRRARLYRPDSETEGVQSRIIEKKVHTEPAIPAVPAPTLEEAPPQP